MGEILEFQTGDVEEVASLYLKVFRRQNRPAPPALQSCFVEMLLQNPWRDPEISSLVYREKGRVVGFLGITARHMIFRGRPIRAAVGSQFMVDREVHRGLAGIELLKRYFNGPQDFSFTDGATDAAEVIWKACGAEIGRLYSFEWTRILRPFDYIRGELGRKAGDAAGAILSPAAWTGDLVLSKLPLRRFRPPRPKLTIRVVGPAELLAAIQEIGWRELLRPHYEPDSFSWLMQQASGVRRHGILHMAVVSATDGRPAGWFVYYVRRGGECKVLQLGARDRDADEVVTALIYDAAERGGTAISGQAFPRFLRNLSNQYCRFWYPGSGVVVQSRDPEILSAIFRGDAVLTRLDGEWWTRFASESWD